MTPEQYEEARRLHAAGLKLVELHPNSKRPVGDGWNHNAANSVRADAGGYGLLLAANGLCSVDVDSEGRCVEGLWRCGFDVDAIRDAGVHTSSTRPGSGGRVTFRVPAGSSLRWVKFSSKTAGTILELRATAANLQDSLPGTVYHSADGSGPWVEPTTVHGRMRQHPVARTHRELCVLTDEQPLLLTQVVHVVRQALPPGQQVIG